MKISYLCFVSRYGEVANCPGSLLLSLELSLGQMADDHGDEAGLYDSLDLLLVACCDVGQEPDGLLR